MTRAAQLEALLLEAQELIWQFQQETGRYFHLSDRIDAALAEPPQGDQSNTAPTGT